MLIMCPEIITKNKQGLTTVLYFVAVKLRAFRDRVFDKLYIESVVCALLQTYGLLGKSEKADEKGRKKGQTKSGKCQRN